MSQGVTTLSDALTHGICKKLATRLGAPEGTYEAFPKLMQGMYCCSTSLSLN